MTKEKERDNKSIRVRITENSFSNLQRKVQGLGISVNNYISFLINSSLQKQEVLFEEKTGKLEKKEIECRVFFTKSEAELLSNYAHINDWSISREVRFRTISTLSQKPKLSGEELKAVYSVRSSINTLGANINRLIINDQVLSDYNISVCKELLELTKELLSKIKYLEKCNNTHFKIKEIGNANVR